MTVLVVIGIAMVRLVGQALIVIVIRLIIVSRLILVMRQCMRMCMCMSMCTILASIDRGGHLR